MSDLRCSEIRDMLPELATGAASGEVRATALAHLAGCAACRRELADTAATVDELLLLAPEREPPPGFDARVLSRLDAGRPSRRRTRGAYLLAAAVVLIVGVAV